LSSFLSVLKLDRTLAPAGVCAFSPTLCRSFWGISGWD
jgi:hypothetical protein